MTRQQADPIRVFVSYSHDSAQHANTVLALSDRLRADGIDCVLDQYEEAPAEGWPRWMDRQLREADFVLVVCTAIYNRRATGQEESGKGRGIRWESTLTYQYIYNAETTNDRFLPLLLEGAHAADIPTPLQGATHYRFPEDYEQLYRRLTGQPLTPKPPIGSLRILPARQRKQDVVMTPLSTSEMSTPRSIQNLPLPRNPFFTGRQAILEHLHALLHTGKTATLFQSTAINGLGGIGKTQTALEYAYRYADEYQTILWVQANSQEILLTELVMLAKLLNLPEQDAKEQQVAVAAVKRWLETHSGWLLIFDNADDPTIVRDVLPRRNQGHILLTTRSQVIGELARHIELDAMPLEEGATLLLRRAGLLAPDVDLVSASSVDREAALAIVQTLGGLPLALDQAGAYLEETHESLFNYLPLYQQHRAALLKRRGGLVSAHPEAVATTWSLALKQVEQTNPAAIALMRFCAFLAPDAIPEALIHEGAAYLGPLLQPVASDRIQLNTAFAALLAYSLIRRDPTTHMLTIHRLVKAIIKDEMDEPTQKAWAERAVRVVNHVFPFEEVAPWPQSQLYLPHAFVCEELIQQWDLTIDEAAVLLHNIGIYFRARGQYQEAEPFYHKARRILEKRYGQNELKTLYMLNNLANLYTEQGKSEEAEPLYQRVLAFYEKMLGPEHPDTAMTLDNLANLYTEQKKNEEAESLYQRALTIREKMLGPEHLETAVTLNNLAILYSDQGKYEEAESLYQRALAIREKMLGPEHPDIAATLNNLAILYRKQGRYKEAESLYQRALAIYEKMLGQSHSTTAQVRENYTKLLQKRGQKTGTEDVPDRI